MKAIFDHQHRENESIVSFWFRSEKLTSFMAGQFVELTLPHPNPDNRGPKRCFTLSSPPTDLPLISITTRLAKDHGSSFKRALQNLKPDAKAVMSEPMGDFVLPKDVKRRLIFVAGGIGITPYASIIRWLLAKKESRDITFIYAVANENDMVFQPELSCYGMKRITVVAQPLGKWSGESGLLNGQRLIQFARPAPDDLIYLAGPEPMVEQLRTDLETQNITSQQIITDHFPGYK
ncbi:MAG TPA: FAD-dependent oxidoreductase [Candidatus Saccharimonadales bacterium]|jgi:ferredoxin-NADP reductase|nr:FAD-dependent oxidoreductase [Candidatus Saccharimonadales bacterium]